MKIYLALSAIVLTVLAVSCDNDRQSAQTATLQHQLPAAPADAKMEKEANAISTKTEEAAAPTADESISSTGVVATDSVAAPGPQDPAPQTPQKPGQPPAPSNPQISWDKKIIKTGTLSVEVGDYKKFNQSIRSFISQTGGYIAQEEQNESDYKIENIMTIKVPVERFEEVMNTLSPITEKVLVKKITSEDVTGAVVDTKSRLEAKRQVRLRYLDLLKQAKNMEEILQVQREVNDLQVEMEAAAGRISYLTHASAMSTIQLTYAQILNPQATDVYNPSFGDKVLNGLRHGLVWVGDLLVLLITLWPLWVLLGGAWWGYKRLRAQRRPSKADPIQVVHNR